MGPVLDAGGLGWLCKTAKANHWKVAHVYDDLEDLIQEGHVCWEHVANRYGFPSSLTSDDKAYSHLMALFKTTFLNRIRELARKDKAADFSTVLLRLREVVTSDHYTEHAIAEFVLHHMNDGGVAAQGSDVEQVIIEATAPVREVLRFLTSERGQAIMRRPYRLRKDGTRETTNERIRRHVKCWNRHDLRQMARQYLQSNL